MYFKLQRIGPRCQFLGQGVSRKVRGETIVTLMRSTWHVLHVHAFFPQAREIRRNTPCPHEFASRHEAKSKVNLL